MIHEPLCLLFFSIKVFWTENKTHRGKIANDGPASTVSSHFMHQGAQPKPSATAGTSQQKWRFVPSIQDMKTAAFVDQTRVCTPAQKPVRLSSIYTVHRMLNYVPVGWLPLHVPCPLLQPSGCHSDCGLPISECLSWSPYWVSAEKIWSDMDN